MEDEKETNSGNESGKSFRDQQSAIDSALNEKIKEESDNDESQVNRKERRDHATTVSHKKTGGGKQKSPGD